MASVFNLILEDFLSELEAIRLLVTTFDSAGKPPKSRVAAANSATLLVAATFEEFIRQCAREYARAVVVNSTSFSELPPKLAATAWKRSLEALSRVRFDVEQSVRDNLFITTKTRFSVVYEFAKGDLSQNIYDDLIHNQNNMRPQELNSMFKVAGLGDVCCKLADKAPIMTHFEEAEAGKAHGKILTALEEFMERRNIIAHALNPGFSTGTDQILKDLNMLTAVAASLCVTLDDLAPKSPAQSDVGGVGPVLPSQDET
ncbi:MAG: hypothetical protein B7Y80_18985 [Hyphomicrobium sp. 32-62-53]|nr:MAG: hypothetical protein B7Z29_17675 [Hyphomicrobium sp. 12-62-95]OYX97699.1 MAG: hypothetical protein B7Y80_18985 [Hyphomicrobium sp. 32-62-53]